MSRGKKALVWLCLGLFALGLFRHPAEAEAAAREGLVQCGTVLIPALFPFLLLSALAIQLGLGAALGRRLQPVTGPLFRIGSGGGLALVLGLVGGYPVGAKTVRQLYDRGLCTREEAGRLILFCNNCGPAFLLSTAGVAVLGSMQAGWLLWLGHVLGAVLLGLLLRRWGTPCRRGPSLEEGPVPALGEALVSAVTESAQASLRLSAFVVSFGVLLRILAESGVLGGVIRLLALVLAPLGVSQGLCATLVTGGMELTRGVMALSGQPVTPGVLALMAFLLGWGGLSVHCQTLAVLQGSGLPFGRYLLGKLCHGVLAAGLTYALTFLLPQGEPVVTLAHSPGALGGIGAALPGFLVVFAAWGGVISLLLWQWRKKRRNSGIFSSHPL